MKTKTVISIAILAGLACMYIFAPVRHYFSLDMVVRLVARIKTNPWAPLLFTATYTASCVIWPLTIFPVAAGVLFGFWEGLLVNTISANVGAWITFFIARWFGRDTVGKLMKGSLKTFDERTTQHGFWAILTFRLVGVPPFLVTNYGSGLSGVRTRDYMLGTFFGMLPWTVAFTYFANTLWAALTTAGQQGFQQAAGRFFLPVLAGAAAFGILIAVTTRLKKRKQAILASVAALAVATGPVRGGTTMDYSGYDRLLHSYVKDGKVNYEGFRKEVGTLQAFIEEIKGVRPEALRSKEAQMAFWINAYNGIVIKAMVDRYPIKSVMDVKGFFDKITYSVGGETLTLNEIEAKARAFKDPRAHFAVVCASSSCPILRSEAYLPERIEQQLAAQGSEFLANTQRGLRFDEVAGAANLSQIFKWYASDFVGGGFLTKIMGSDKILKALEPYMDDATRHKAESRRWKIEYIPYDWTLNKQ